MYAFQVVFQPDLLKANNGESIIDELGREVNIGYIRKCYENAQQVIGLLTDYELGIFNISMDEYQRLPLPLLESIRIWKRTKIEIQKSKEKR